MRTTLTLAIITLGASAAGCGMMNRSSGTEISAASDTRNNWTATLATPSTLAGAVQLHGTASWMRDGNDSKVMVSISNATPGGRHPWHVHSGRCGSNGPIVGNPGAYKALEVNGDGNASESASLSIPLPYMNDYYVNIHAAANNMGTIVACGNLAPPVH
ncbi:MAG: hypothetical protein M3Z05_16525 [Gemmatimonadota bacterium]|nr:hypothetical protein [Gemmatimonadota bacterium]